MTPETLGILNDDVRAGVGAETLGRVLGPILDRHITQLLNELEKAPSDLNIILDIRSRLGAYTAIRRELDQIVQLGKEAQMKLP